MKLRFRPVGSELLYYRSQALQMSRVQPASVILLIQQTRTCIAKEVANVLLYKAVG